MHSDGILIIGCGKQAEKHIPGLKKAGIDHIVLYDVAPDQAHRLAEKAMLTAVEDLDSALADRRITAVDICTPTPTHFPLLDLVFAAGKHAFVEKPLCETAAQARILLDRSEAAGCKCAVGYIYRFAPAFEKLKELVGAPGAPGPLGRPIAATFQIGGRGSHAVWKHTRSQGGGAKNEMLVHMLDLAIWLFGTKGKVELLVEKLLRPQRVIKGEVIQADAEDYVVARADFGGVESLIQADFVTPAFSQFVSVQGENGTFIGSIQPGVPSSLFLDKAAGNYDKGTTKFNFSGNDLFEKQMGDFVESIRLGGRAPRCPIGDSLKVMEILEALRRLG